MFVIENFNYICSQEERYIYANYENYYYTIKTPKLKILKKVYENNNKKYLILELNEDTDFDDEIKTFIYQINKIHELCQNENLKNGSKWFGKKFDIFDLDRIIKRPIEIQRNINYIKIILENDLLEKINEYDEENIICYIYFKGLKITKGNMIEEWYLSSIYKPIINENINNDVSDLNTISNIQDEINEQLNSLIEDEDIDNSVLDNTEIEENILENLKYKKNKKINIISRSKIYTFNN